MHYIERLLLKCYLVFFSNSHGVKHFMCEQVGIALMISSICTCFFHFSFTSVKSKNVKSPISGAVIDTSLTFLFLLCSAVSMQQMFSALLSFSLAHFGGINNL